MSDFVLLQNYARNLLLRYFLGCANVIDVEPGFKGSLEVFAKDWRGKLKVVGREQAGRNLYLDPHWQEEGARVLAVYLTRLRHGLADRRAEVVALARAQPSRLDGEKRQAFASLGGGERAGR